MTALGLLLAAAGVDPLLSASPPPHPANPAEPSQPSRHAETIYVREAGVLVEMPPPRRLEKLRRAWRPGDFQLLVDGQPREVVAAGSVTSNPSGTAAGWEIVLYFDSELTPTAALADAARLLARLAARLAALGSVEIVLADPAPRTVFAPSRDAARGSAALKELAGAVEGRAADFPARRLPDLVRRQCDRLIAFAGRSHDSRPQVLFWVGAADLPISPAEQTALSGATAAEGPPPVPGPLAAAFVATAQALAAAGWVTFPIAVRPLPPPPPSRASPGTRRCSGRPTTRRSRRATPSPGSPRTLRRRRTAPPSAWPSTPASCRSSPRSTCWPPPPPARSSRRRSNSTTPWTAWAGAGSSGSVPRCRRTAASIASR
ncbi:MAG TPA: hypothetical protein VFE33_04705 [Thermoanaerobaculia bacterium]|nr:hypothetical protein [Thermoanaerobaculia bacterium]